MKSINFRWKIVLLTFGLISLIVCILGGYFYLSIYNKAEDDISHIENELIDIKKKELKSVTKIVFSSIESASEELTEKTQEKLKANTEMVFALLEARYQEAIKSSNPRRAIQKTKKELIREFDKLRFDETGYLWIHSYNPREIEKPYMIMHPFVTEANGKDISEFRYTSGPNQGEIIYATNIEDSVPFFVQMNLVVANNGEGFVDYDWPKPGHKGYQAKSSFVKLFKPFGWVIGIGAYIDDIEPEIKKEAVSIIRNFRYGADKQDYFWIHSYDPFDTNHVEMIMHPIISELEGEDMSEFRYTSGKLKGEIVAAIGDKDSVPFLMEMNNIVRRDVEGHLSYLWPRPTKDGLSEYKRKLSYFKLFDKWNWVIGTGVYLEDIEKVKNQKMVSLKEQTSEFLLVSIIISAIALFISFFSIDFMSKTLSKPLKILIQRMKEYASGDHSLSKLPESNDEIGEISDAFSELRKENVELLDTLQDQVDEQTEALSEEKKLSQLKSAFINTISHEYRTPLTAISSSVMLVDMMTKNQNNEDMAKYVNNIRIGVRTLTNLVEDVVDYDKIQKSDYIIREKPIDFIAFCKEIIEEVKLIDEDHHCFKFESNKDKINLFIDSKLYRQILVQTLKNAVKYSPEKTDIQLKVEKNNGDIRLSVIDNGIGISEKALEQIYKPFFKEEHAIGIQSGNGLGMAIVKSYIEILGGKIEVESKLNIGTTFRYIIPIRN